MTTLIVMNQIVASCVLESVLKGSLQMLEQACSCLEMLWVWSFRLEHGLDSFIDVEDDLFAYLTDERQFKLSTQLLVHIRPACDLLR